MNNKFFRDRYSILSFLIIIMIIVIVCRLFSLQIASGAYYKQESEKKLYMVNTIKAPRGEVLDRYGNVLANNRPGFAIEIIKTKIDDNTLNKVLLEVIKILEKNNNSYKDNLPITLPYQFGFSSSKEEESWKKKYKISLNADAKQAFGELRDKYKIDPELEDADARKILTLRYEMSEYGFNSFKTVVLAYDISKETVGEIEERNLELPGISIVVNPIRNYPNGTLASHILGYIGKISQTQLQKLLEEGYDQSDVIGKDGIENISEKCLKGIDGKRFIEADLSGRLSRALQNQDPIPGGKVVLTIDKKLQKSAEDALQATISKLKAGAYSSGRDAEGGVAIAVDVNTGEILALASYPSYDPSAFARGITTQEWNKLNKDPLRPLYNKAISGRYAPGSTFKMITGLAALEEGKVSVNETILDTGVYEVEGYPFKCWIWTQSGGTRTHGPVNISDALKVSCNTYFYEVSRRLDANSSIYNLERYASMFGLTSKTGIELLGEETSIVSNPELKKKLHNEIWYPGDVVQAAIGQLDTSITPIAMASYISTLANGGTQHKLHLISTQKSYDGRLTYPQDSFQNPRKLNINPKNLRAVLEGMRRVANDKDGTAYSIFKDFGVEATGEKIEVAAKTGTSQTLINTRSPHAWFVGFAPYDNPTIAVVVLIEYGGSGGYAAPVAKEIFTKYFNFDNVLQQTENKIEGQIDIIEQVD